MDLKMSIHPNQKLLDINLYLISFFILLLNNRPWCLILPLHRWLNLKNIIQTILIFETKINIIPRTGNFITDFTIAIICSTTRTIKKTFRTSGNRANTAGISEYTMSTGSAFFFIHNEDFIYPN